MTVTILIGDVFTKLAELPDESVHCAVTSPPYWGLRDYGVEGQIGLEPTLQEHLEIMVKVFAEVHRVLRKDGTCWINYGDCYAASVNGRSATDTKATGNDDRTFRDKPFSTVGPIYNPNHHTKDRRGEGTLQSRNKGSDTKGAIEAGGLLKPKDLCMVPNRLAIALQDWGWWVRSEIIWHKPNPMPESITDRPGTSHEKIWLLSKSQKYFYDADAVRIPSDWNPNKTKEPDGWDTGPGGHGNVHKRGRDKGKKKDKQRGHGKRHAGFNDRWDQMTKEEQQAAGRNLRNVWTVATKPFSEAHFATFPPDLIIPCIKAGCPEGGVVLDPFGGAGTTGLVADRLGRDAILIELNPEYAEIARKRISGDSPLFTEVK